ncbi:MAG: biotin--[acetyl-CoA-carboxylase] ligase [Kiritimatiellia bacterium]
MSTSSKILELLKNSSAETMSSSVLCEALGISRNAVWKHVNALRARGYVIDAHSRCGYRLVESPDRPCASEVIPLLNTEFAGRSLIFKENTVSTNSDASSGAENGCADGTLFCADAQSGGRGRMKRHWFSPSGINLYFSLVLRPGIPVSQASSLPLVAGIGLVSAIKKLAPELNPQVKWPNDILIDGKKVCGILCEMQAEIDCRVRYIIAGAGINVNLAQSALPGNLQEIATSLKIECRRNFSRTQLLAEIINQFEPLYTSWVNNGFAPLKTRMDEFDALKNRPVQIQQGKHLLSGIACGVQDDGALLIHTGKGMELAYSGEIKAAFSGNQTLTK